MFHSAHHFPVSELLKTYRPGIILYRLAECVVAEELTLEEAERQLAELVLLTGGFFVVTKESTSRLELSPEEAFTGALRRIACVRLSNHIAYQRMTWLQVTVAIKRLAEQLDWGVDLENALIQKVFQVSEKIVELKQEYEHSSFPVSFSDDQFRLYMNPAFLDLLRCPTQNSDPFDLGADVEVDYFECMNHFLALPYLENVIQDDWDITWEALDCLDTSQKVAGHFVSVYQFPHFHELFNLPVVSPADSEGHVICLRWIAETRGDYRIAIAEDYTERRRLSEETSKRMCAEAKAKLAEEMVHDVNNTLQVVLGNTDLLKSSISTLLHRLERQGFVSGLLRNDALDTLRRSVEQVDGIVLAANYQRELAMRVLTDSKLRAGDVVLQNEPINLKALLASVTKMYTVVAAEKSVLLHCQLPKVACCSLGDCLALQTILTNLIGNAIKFTRSGQIIVLLEVLEEKDNGKQLVAIRVADTGIGMAPEECQLLLKQVRRDATRLDSKGGFGLGLSICQRLVNLMNGHLDIESERDVGTTVSVTLELECLPLDQYSLLREEDWLAA